jgi:anti-sigma B factor antagonist
LTFGEVPFVVLVHERDGIPVVKVSGELDLLTAPTFRETLEQVVRDAEPGGIPVVVDLGGVGFMDSCGINALVGATRDFAGRGGRVRLVIKSSPVERTISVTGLDDVFDVYPDVNSASCRGVA